MHCLQWHTNLHKARNCVVFIKTFFMMNINQETSLCQGYHISFYGPTFFKYRNKNALMHFLQII